MIISPNFRFLSSRTDPSESRWRLIGLPYDAASSYRRGAQYGPAEIRRASDSIESYSPYLEKDLEGLNFYDVGDLDLVGKFSEEAVIAIQDHYIEETKQDRRCFALGGDHAVTIGAVQGLVQAGTTPFVLYLDAHLDLRESYTGGNYSHACVARRLAATVGPDHLIQWGMRSGEKTEYEWAQKSGTYLGRNPISLRKTCLQLHGKPVYVSLDLDLFDPAELPGVGNPEPGGLHFTDFLQLLPAMGHLNVIGADVVELAPTWDTSERSSVLTAEIVRELLLTFIK